jgi:hypothetical protein
MSNAVPEVKEPPTGGTPEEAGEPESAGFGPLPLDQVFDVLRNERRRRALRFLVENGGRAEMSELAEALASWETGKSVEELSASERKRVYVALYQCHLPRMDDVEVIEFNKPRGVIELGRNAAALNRYLEDARELRTVRPWRGEEDDTTDEPASTQPWPRYYAAVVLVGGVLFVASLGVGALATQVVLGGLLLAVATLSVLHLRAVGELSLPGGE